MIKDKRKIIIDTDPGHDDALALILLLKSQQFDIQAITTVAGNATIDKVTRNAQAIADLVGSKVPIYSGSPSPITRPLITAVVHGESGLDGFDTTSTKFRLTNDAPQKIVDIVRKYPGEVTILTLGPLSNIARAFQLDPEIINLIPEIVTMGGAIDVPGNKNRVAEFNFFVDPEAASVVFESRVPKIIVPLDVCNDIVLQINDFKKIGKKSLQQALVPMMEHFAVGLIGDEGTKGLLVYDALAAYYLLNPKAYVLELMNVLIETKGEYTFGMSVAEKRRYKNEKPNASVVRQIQQDQFISDFFRIVDQ